jgi:monoamine oxidase
VSNALNMLFLISTDTATFKVFGDSDELFHAKDGNDTFTTRLAEALDPAQLKLNTALQAIRETADGRYQLTFQRDKSTFDVTADHVVLALPFSILRELDVKLDLPEPKKLAIAELGYGTNSKLMCGFSSRPWRTAGLSRGETYTDLAYQTTWETSRLQPGESGIITNFLGGERGIAVGDGTPEERMADFLTQFDQVFPGVKAVSNGKVARFHWPSNPLVKGSYSSYKVGQYTRFTGSEFERFKNVHFCGEHTSLDAQGFMEGGALTGAAAADEILTDIGMPESAPASAPLSRRPLSAEARLSLPGDRILARARATRALRRWHAALPRFRRAR